MFKTGSDGKRRGHPSSAGLRSRYLPASKEFSLILKLFEQANAGEYWEKHAWFYPFKSEYLKKHARADGVDLQIIEDKCWCGNGMWKGNFYPGLPKSQWMPCFKCEGTGIYRRRKILLARWNLNGILFHEPTTLNPDLKGNIIQETIHGVIQHSGVSNSQGRRALFLLFFFCDRQRFIALSRLRWRNWWRKKIARVKLSVKHLYWKMKKWNVGEEDDVPF